MVKTTLFKKGEMKLRNLNFDDGYKKFMVNNDPNRVVRFNPADINLLDRLDQAQKRIEEEQKKLQEDVELLPNGEPASDEENHNEILTGLRSINKLIKDQVDYIFDSEVADIVFGKQSPLSTVKGKPLFERFLEATKPFLEEEIAKEQKASQERINKYTKVYHK